MRPHGAIIFAFIVLPYVYVFGTGIVYWVAVPAAVIFWVLGGVTLLAPQIRSSGTWTMLLSLILTLQMALVLTLYGGLESPYRQPQRVWQYDQPTKVGRTESVLTFSAVQARYIHDMTTAAEEAGLKTGTPVFNRTGHFPGILYTLQVESLGSPWPIQGYKGGENAIIAALERTSCEKIASAWVLDEPKGEKRVSSGVLPPFGADFETDYERVGVWTMPAVIAGRAEDMEQVLLKPTRPLEVATQVCLEKRRSLSSK